MTKTKKSNILTVCVAFYQAAAFRVVTVTGFLPISFKATFILSSHKRKRFNKLTLLFE